MTDEQTTDDLIEQINAHPRSALIEALADAMHSIEDDDGNGRHISYYRSLAFATVEILPALFYDEDALCDEPGCGAHRAAGPAPSSASPGGTGGLAELLARLQAEVQSLAGMAQAAADVIEGQRRAAWDSLVESARRQEQVPSDTQAGYTMGWRAAHDLLTGRHLEDHEYEALLAGELDSRYGTDRAKGGGPRD